MPLYSLKVNTTKIKILIFKKILLNQANNSFLINNLNLTKDFKIDYIGLIDLDFINKNEKINKITLKKIKKIMKLKVKFSIAVIYLRRFYLEKMKEEYQNFLII